MTNGLPIIIRVGACTVWWRGGYQTVTWLPPDLDPYKDMWEFGVPGRPGRQRRVVSDHFGGHQSDA